MPRTPSKLTKAQTRKIFIHMTNDSPYISVIHVWESFKVALRQMFLYVASNILGIKEEFVRTKHKFWNWK